MSDPRTELRDRIAAALADRFTGRAGPLVGDTYLAFADAVMELFPNVGAWYWDPKGRWWGEPQDDSFQVTFTARTGLYPLPSRSPSTESETPA